MYFYSFCMEETKNPAKKPEIIVMFIGLFYVIKLR